MKGARAPFVRPFITCSHVIQTIRHFTLCRPKRRSFTCLSLDFCKKRTGAIFPPSTSRFQAETSWRHRRNEKMAAENDASNNAILRSLLELAGEDSAVQLTACGSGGVNSENVAQLLAAAIAQVGQSILAGSGQTQPAGGDGESTEGGVAGGATTSVLQTSSPSSENLPVNPLSAVPAASGDAVFDLREAYESVPQASTLAITDADVASTVEVPANGKPRPLCVKFPIELRKQIISMRKSGKLSKDIAKELKVSVSGVQKVWERFLATGMAHDRKPSSYAGRPRKSTYSQVSTILPLFHFPYYAPIISYSYNYQNIFCLCFAGCVLTRI